MRAKWMITTWIGVLGMLLLAGPAMAAQRQAEITSLNGKAEWLKSGSATWQPVTINQKLENGDKVRTDEKGELTLTLDDGSTIQLYPGSEFAIQTLNKKSADQQLESVLAIMKGKLKANVTPLKNGSKFQVETPAMVAAVKGTTFTLTVNPDGSVSASSEDGTVDLTQEGENKFTVHTDAGDEVLVEVDPATGQVKITDVTGTFEVVGPDGITRTLHPGETIIFSAGAATFVPATPPGPDAPPGGDPFGEPTGSTDTTGPSSVTESAISSS